MKTLSSLIACCVLFVFGAASMAQFPERASPTPEDYEAAISAFKDMTKKSLDLKAWKDRKVTNTDTKEEKKFGELPALEQHVILLDMADRVSHNMASLQAAWEQELKKFDNPAHKLVPRPKIDNQKQNPAVKADVESYHKELLTLRKEYAVSYEKFVEKFLKDFEKDIDKKEAKMTLDEVRAFHDKQKLIERKKDK